MIFAGAGFAMMAWKEAQWRTEPAYRREWPHHFAACQSWNGPDAEYFRILDRASKLWENRCGEGDCYCARVRL